MEKNREVHEVSQDQHIVYTRPAVLEGRTQCLKTPCGSFYLTLNHDGARLVEVRMLIGKSGNCVRGLFENIAILISVLLQSGFPREKIADILIKQMECNCGNRMYSAGKEYHSCLDYAIHSILEDLAGAEEIEV